MTFHAPVEARANVCFAGEDIAPGKCLVPAGTRLDEVSLGLLAGQGVQTVTVYAKPRAALMPTGDELCSPETPLRPGKIYDSNGPMLAARMLRLGAEPTLLAAGSDDPAALAGKLARLLAEYPLVITTGGVSVGDRDYLPQAAEEAGAKRRGKTGMSCSASPETPLPALRRLSCWPGLHWPNCRGLTPPPCG